MAGEFGNPVADCAERYPIASPPLCQANGRFETIRMVRFVIPASDMRWFERDTATDVFRFGQN
jgi:hypothetical protein